MDIQYIAEIAMQVISYGGMAKSAYMQALESIKTGDLEKGGVRIQEGDDHALRAHKIHAELLAREMEQGKPQVSLLMMHAEDQLMNAETIRILVIELRDIYIDRKEHENDE